MLSYFLKYFAQTRGQGRNWVFVCADFRYRDDQTLGLAYLWKCKNGLPDTWTEAEYAVALPL